MAPEFMRVTYRDELRSGQYYVLQLDRDGETEAVHFFLPDEELARTSLSPKELSNQILDVLCKAWYDKYGVHVTYAPSSVSGAAPLFKSDNVIEGEIVTKEIGNDQKAIGR